MNNLHLAIIAALVVAVMMFVTSEVETDMADFQKKISRQTDYQAYDDKPLLPETIFQEVGK
jgi:hypothetical protein